ncbi:MucBP domain-containing protein [Enterococcus alishanensis]|uniref:MucBP domain-containing protein n=1 Tax=Enterococcus alishanensis TaxID=1303817 RepID=A0ABS6T7L1_9ENTE|nr:MucBP domain-containing protein [Enterococcus alishanensis]MBV7389133.1 MucBP domain-containing protein [Enterococcus alishanensis]
MKKRLYLLGFLLSGLFLVGFSTPVFGTEVNTIADLENAVNQASSNQTITLGDTFPTEIDQTIKLKETAYQTVIDGGGKTLQAAVGKSVQIFSYGAGTGDTNSELTLQNLKLAGNGTTDKSKGIDAGGYTGTLILDNLSISHFNGGGHGGAMYIASNTAIKNSNFSDNVNYNGGYSGGAIGTADGFSKKLSIMNTRFNNNSTTDVTGPVVGGEGGAIHFHQPAATAVIELKNNYFEGNSAAKNVQETNQYSLLADGGALSFWNVKKGVTIQLTGNTFANNIAGDDGGAILLQSNESIPSGITFKNNTFYGNQALGNDKGSNSGGAIQVFAVGLRTINIDYINNSFINNFATYSGGAIGNSGSWGIGGAGKFYNNLFVGNISQSDAKTNNVGGAKTISKKNSNIGLEEDVTMADVFGLDTMDLLENYGKISAGAAVDGSTTIIPTVPIAPEKVADDKIDNYVDGIDSVLDQRGRPRPDETDLNTNGLKSDPGSVEINWLKYDANGGTFELNKALTTYDGKIYYEGENPTAYYQVGYDQLATTIVDGANTLKATKANAKFLGWSENKAATKPDVGLEVGKAINIVKGNQTLYAIYQEKAADVKVRYIEIDSAGNEVKELDQITLTGFVGDSFEAEVKMFENYGLVNVKDGAGNPLTSMSGTFTDQAQTIIFEYKPDVSTVVVSHQDEAGNPLADTKILTGKINSAYTTSAETISGYSLVATPTNANGNYAEDITYVKYIYKKDTIAGGQVTIKYQDEEGNPLFSPDIVINQDIGTVYNTEIKSFEGYTLKAVKGQLSGLVTDEPQEVVLVYQKIKQGQDLGTVLVHYVDETGLPIALSEVKTGEIDEAYDTEAKKINGYTGPKIPDNAKGTYSKDLITVTYVYQKIPTPVETGKVTYYYQDEQGKELADAKEITGNVGDVYPGTNTDVIKTIPDYYLTEVKGNLFGIYQAQPQTVTLIYAKQAVKNGLVITRYQDEQGEDIAMPDFSIGAINTAYETKQKTIDGFTFKETKGNTKGKYSDEVITIIYVYSKNEPTIPTTGGKNTSNYIGSGGNGLAPTNYVATNTAKTLPKTGENKKISSILSIVGIMLLVGVVMIIYRRKAENH